MGAVKLILRIDASEKVFKELGWYPEFSNVDEHEAYYNVGADEVLNIIACYLFEEADYSAGIEIKHKGNVSNIEDKVSEEIYESFISSICDISEEYFQLGFRTGFKVSVEASKN